MSNQTDQKVCSIFCNGMELENCPTTVLRSCLDCNFAAVVVVATLMSLIGVVSIAGNLLVIAVLIYRFWKKKSFKLDSIKLSLAVVNLVTATQIFVMLSSLISKFSVTGDEYQVDSDKTDVEALHKPAYIIIYGLLMYGSFMSTIYHLLMLGIQRFLAIVFPFKLNQQSNATVYACLGAIWALTILVCSVPFMLPDTYLMCHQSFVYYLCMLAEFSVKVTVYTIVTMICPIIAMIVLSIITAVKSYQILGRFKRNKILKERNTKGDERARKYDEKKHTDFRQQHAVLINIAIMQIGFIITITPTLANFIASTTGEKGCYYKTLQFAGFCVLLASSLINVVVYLVRDGEFQKSVKELFGCCG